MTIAKEKYGMDMTDDMAARYMEKHADKFGKLSDDELDNVSGGYTVCDAEKWEGKYCEPCGVWCDGMAPSDEWVCPVCKTRYY